jgi:hypothetical protein
MTFKALKSDAYKVTIFDCSMNQIVRKSLQHDRTFAIMEE